MIPNPGSKEAIEAGCLCPRMDNRWGKGLYTADDGSPVFNIAVMCPLHGTPPDEPSDYVPLTGNPPKKANP